jgi:adenylate kinase family enzyme
MKRILIIGSAGAGKTTLAHYLGQHLALPVIHLDQLFWRPGWVAPPVIEWKQQVNQLLARPTWILDGYYHNTLDVTCRAADTILFFYNSNLSLMSFSSGVAKRLSGST